MMLKERKNQPPLVVRIGISTLLLVGIVSAGKSMGWFDRLPSVAQIQDRLSTGELTPGNSAVLPLAKLSPTQRAAKLEAIASGPKSLDRNRARYMLASDLIEQRQGQKALQWLEGLENDYRTLADHILFKRAQAYELSGDKANVTETWQELLKRYPDHPVAAEALFALGKSDAKHWDEAIAKFPSHPRTHEIVLQRLKQTPNQPDLMRLLIKHAPEWDETKAFLEPLVTRYSAQLKPEDWEMIAFIHWQNRVYGKAGDAYANAPATSLNLYRAGRGRQLGNDRIKAVVSYKRLVSEFPDAKETGIALLRLADLARTPQEAISYLNQAIKKFPEQAGEALLTKARLLDRTSDTRGATQAIQLALTKYGNSDAVANYRWRMAQQRVKDGDLLGAWKFAQEITKQNPKSDIAPQAAFWVGKWAKQLGRQNDAKTAFEYVLRTYPDTYYAWRSATLLGLPVGDFTSVRPLSPQLIRPTERPTLPTGSPTVQELYQIGQNQDAWKLWHSEFNNYLQPTVAEQFTDGLIRLGIGQNLRGIFQVGSLAWRDKPEDRAQVEALKQQPIYWQALYPFPFMEFIESWSQQRQLNPLLVIALMRQESRFEPAIRSIAGATGLMQVMPATGKWIAQAINLKEYALDDPNDNIKLGTWYLDHTHAQYQNNSLLAVASYNAGPGNVSKWLRERDMSDPDRFVESIPFDETRGYVKSVFENYWNYMRLYNPEMGKLLTQYKRK